MKTKPFVIVAAVIGTLGAAAASLGTAPAKPGQGTPVAAKSIVAAVGSESRGAVATVPEGLRGHPCYGLTRGEAVAACAADVFNPALGRAVQLGGAEGVGSFPGRLGDLKWLPKQWGSGIETTPLPKSRLFTIAWTEGKQVVCGVVKQLNLGLTGWERGMERVAGVPGDNLAIIHEIGHCVHAYAVRIPPKGDDKAEGEAFGDAFLVHFVAKRDPARLALFVEALIASRSAETDEHNTTRWLLGIKTRIASGEDPASSDGCSFALSAIRGAVPGDPAVAKACGVGGGESRTTTRAEPGKGRT